MHRRPPALPRLLVPTLLWLGLCLQPAIAGTNLSAWIFPGSSGRLLRQPDALGNRILDYSEVGYRGGAVPLPSSNTVPVKVVVSPVAGDNVANIQNAINQVSALPPDANGFRGAVLLSAGLYPCARTLTISASGVVLRGVGSATNGTGTVLEATATNQYTLIEVRGSGSPVSGSTHTITNNYVPVGACSFSVDATNGLYPGAEVFVRHVATSNWIHDLGMDLLGPPPDVPWTPSGYMIDMDRVITHLEGNQVFVDAPITCALDAHYANGTIRPFTWSGLLTNVGVEHFYAKSDYFGSTTNETHGWTCIQVDNTIHSWVRDVVSQYFGYSCVNLNGGDKFITVQDCQSLDPVSIITGGRRYAFTLNDAQYCLVKNCYTRQDRHQFVTQSLTIGPNVFVDGLSDSAHAEAGPHQRWATGIVWDNLTIHGGNNDIQNAGNYGTGHGWEGANCVIWNNRANAFIVQDPPGAHNWLIGSVGPIQTGTAWNIGYTNMPHAPGDYDSSGTSATNVFPNSLYFSQLQDRLSVPHLQARDYWLGDIDQFSHALGGDSVPLDLGWSNAVRTAAAGQALDPFDVVTNNHWVPFTFHFSLAPTEQVVAATLAVSLRALNSAAADVLYLNSTTNPVTFASLGWLPVGTSTNTTVRLLDLTGQLNLLTNGQLNVAAQGDLGIDWAMLELQVAPNPTLATTSLAPNADATVRGGTSAGLNFGTATTLTVRQDASANNVQQAYLRWDLSSLSGSIAHARVVLTPTSVPAPGIEQGVAVANSNNWTETGLTWNNQPGYGERFATWLAPARGQVSFDVTPQVLDALQNDRQLSLALFSLTTNTVAYASREAGNPATQPQLLLWLLGTPPSISSISDRTVAPNSSTGPIPFTVGGSASSSLTLTADSSNPALVPEANIVLGGSGTNRTVTLTPAANQTGATLITLTVMDPAGESATTSFTLTVSSHPASVITWNGPGAGANTWSSAGHWFPAEVPEFLDDVEFFDAGASGVAVSNVNNYVDANFGGNIASLQYGNTNGNHTTALALGTTLSLGGVNGLTVGTETDNGLNQTVFATLTGPGGTLAFDNSAASLVVRQGTANSGGSQRATLDLSGVGTVTGALDQVLVGCAGPVNRATGTLYLGKTNTLTLTGSPGLCIGDNHSNSGGQNLVYLGAANTLNVDSLTTARQKATGTLRFNPALATPAALFRASDGVSRVSTWAIADNSAQSSSSSSADGTNDFSGGSVDALVDTLVLGKSQQTTGANSYGVLTFTAGTFDVNTLQIGFQAQSGATSGGIGRVNVNGPNAQLVVNSLLELGHTSGGTGSTNTVGTLFINGGWVSANAIAAGAGSGTNLLAMNGGTLVAGSTVGTPAAPIAMVALTNATLQFPVASGVTDLVATSLLTGGSSNVLTITALPALTSLPAQFPLLQYAGAMGGRGFNFTLGALPADGVYSAYLSNNLANHSVDLVITGYTPPDAFLTWNGNLDGDWDTETANWKNNVATDLTYADGTAVVFNDSASGVANITLTDTFVPDGVTVSNTAKTFTFAGPGSLSGGMVLTKQGSGTLLLANSGSNDFTGGVVLQAGRLALSGLATLGVNGPIALGSGATLDVSQRSDGTLILGPGQTLSGAGTVAGSLLVSSNATVSPGPDLSTLTVTNVVWLQGTISMELNKAAGTNDVLGGAASVVFAGTLNVTNLAGALAAGDHFRLFNAGTYSGAFDTILPPTPGAGLVWDTSSLLINGTLGVTATPRPVLNAVSLSGATLVLRATNGLPGSTGFLLRSTNLQLPFANWTRIATDVFDAYGAFAVTNAIDPVAAQRFYRLQLP